MIQLAISKGFNVRSTTFPHKDIHKETLYSADGRTANQIDHVLISNRFRSGITYTRAQRRPNIGSDNTLLKINFKVKLRVKTEKKLMRKEKLLMFFKIQSGNKNMLWNLIIGSKYWKIWKMKLILTIILMKNGKTFKQ
jgi:hypothetical protein